MWPRRLSRVVKPPGSSHRSPGSSDWRPGSSFWSPRRCVWPHGWCVISGNRNSWLCSRPGLGIRNRHTLVHPSLQQRPHGHKINQCSLVDRCWHWREKRTADTCQDGCDLSTRWRIPCWSSMGCWAVQCQRLMACWAVQSCRVVKLDVRCWLLACWVGNFLWSIQNNWLIMSCWPVTCRPVICWAVTCRVVPCRAVTCRAVICWPLHNLWRTCHWCRAGDFSCRFVHVIWSGRRRDHCYGSPLWGLGNGRGQLHFPSGDVWWTRPFSTLSSSLMMMTRQRLAVGRRPWWRWWQGSAITRGLATMMSMRGRGQRRASVALETRLDPEPPVESTCLLELDPPEELGRDRSPSLRPLSCLEVWCLGELKFHLLWTYDIDMNVIIMIIWQCNYVDPSMISKFPQVNLHVPWCFFTTGCCSDIVPGHLYSSQDFGCGRTLWHVRGWPCTVCECDSHAILWKIVPGESACFLVSLPTQ